MDAMALLCNMHADGPATIKLLRRAGFSSLSDVTRARTERLADLLGVSPAYARRFAREARLLGERMGENVLDREENAELDASDPGRVGVRIDPAPDRTGSIGPDRTRSIEGEETVAPLDAGVSAIQRDNSAEIPATPERTGFAPATSFARSNGDAKGELRVGAATNLEKPASRDEFVEVVTEKPAEARVLESSGLALRPGLIDGLDVAGCDRLVAQGVLTLETLVDAPGMKLARRLGVPFTDLLNLQLLAQRKIVELRIPESARAVEMDFHSRRSAPESEPEYVIYPPRRAIEEVGDEASARDVADLGRDPMDNSDAATVHVAAREGSLHDEGAEDVGGPFA